MDRKVLTYWEDGCEIVKIQNMHIYMTIGRRAERYTPMEYMYFPNAFHSGILHPDWPW